MQETTNGDGQDRFIVYYPSGDRFALRGRFAVIGSPHGALPTIDTGNEIVILDPRAVVLGRDGLVYDATDLQPDRLAPWVREWLRERAA